MTNDTEELTHWKRLWCWERLKAGGERDDRGCDGWMASPTRWTWVWATSGSWWWTGKLACCSPWGRRECQDWATEPSWMILNLLSYAVISFLQKYLFISLAYFITGFFKLLSFENCFFFFSPKSIFWDHRTFKLQNKYSFKITPFSIQSLTSNISTAIRFRECSQIFILSILKHLHKTPLVRVFPCYLINLLLICR